MKSLEEHLNARDNNFNIIRMLASIAVIFSHSFILANGPSDGADPFAKIFGFSLSSLAVDTFFIISGLLVTKSLIERNSTIFFILSRAFRIFPGLIIAVLFSALIIGPLVTELLFIDYIVHPDTKSFIYRNIYIFDNVIQFSLPGVFLNLPYKFAVNGSLWTLPWELYAYTSIFSLYLLSRVYYKIFFSVTLIIIYSVFFNDIYSEVEMQLVSPTYLKLFVMFYSGVAFYLFRSHIKLSIPLFFIVISAYFLIKDFQFSSLLFPFVLSYSIISLAYLFRGILTSYNKLGDYSYGTYIYAFPIQQLLVLYLSPTGWGLFFLSTLITLILAIASWHFIEKPSMTFIHKIAIQKVKLI